MPECETETDINCADPVFNELIVKKILSELNPTKTPGVDSVHPYVLKMCLDSMSRPLSKIFENSYSSGIVPELWRNANITALYKKGNKLQASNYRPISLTSVICKCMEKIIKSTVTDHLYKEKLIIDEQHGFVPSKGCVTNL